MAYEFRLPDIGEGVAEGEILKWMVKEGDRIAEDQPLVEVMTDKVNIQIPSPRAGTISKLLAAEGEVVKVGQPIVAIKEDEEEEKEVGGDVAADDVDPTETGEKMKGSDAERPVHHPPPPPPPAAAATVAVPPISVGGSPVSSSSGSVLATPATRKMARELGVELSGIKGTGQGGRITEQDVRNATGAAQNLGAKKKQEEVVVVPLRGVRKIIAERLARASATTAHVTHFDEADVTELIALKESMRTRAGRKDGEGRLTFTPFFVKAVVIALKEFPSLNATLDEKTNSIVIKKYYNIGIASDTEQGLIVPVVKNADEKNISDLAVEIEEHTERARAGRLDLQEVQGSTFTITNIGGIGGLFATPIINYPEVAILGTHKIVKRPVVRKGSIEVRDMMYLSLTFDHRVVDGAYVARFMNRLVEVLQDPDTIA